MWGVPGVGGVVGSVQSPRLRGAPRHESIRPFICDGLADGVARASAVMHRRACSSGVPGRLRARCGTRIPRRRRRCVRSSKRAGDADPDSRAGRHLDGRGRASRGRGPRTAAWTIVPERGRWRRSMDSASGSPTDSIRTIHESSDGLYHERKDDGSPYYGLLATFSDLPWPTLALGLGEPIPEECAMQLHSGAPWLQPTSVETVEVDGPGATAHRSRERLRGDADRRRPEDEPSRSRRSSASTTGSS